MLTWIGAGLTVLGGFAEGMGVAYVAQDVTGKGPASVGRWFGRRGRTLATLWWGALSRVGYHRKRSTVIMGATGNVTLEGLAPRIKITRSANRPLELRLADIEADVGQLQDELADVAAAMREFRNELERQPATVRGLATTVADERIAAWNRDRLPIQMRSFWWLLAGIVMVTGGGLLGAVAD